MSLSCMLAQLKAERDELEATIEVMIGEMADTPAVLRKSGYWAPDGALTQRYLATSNRLAEVEQTIVDISCQIAAAKKSSA